jgi:hypothetical protein
VNEQYGVAGVALGDVLSAPAPASPQRVRKLQGGYPCGSQFSQRRHAREEGGRGGVIQRFDSYQTGPRCLLVKQTKEEQ